MSNRPGVLTQIFRSLRKTLSLVKQKEYLIGEDELGNRYFEKPADPSKGLKQQRRVEARDPDEYRVPDVPVEWMTWLQGRRKSPPSTQEIEKNYISMLKTQHRAEELERTRQIEEEPESKVQQTKPNQVSGDIKFPVYSEYEAMPGDLYNKDRQNDKTTNKDG